MTRIRSSRPMCRIRLFILLLFGGTCSILCSLSQGMSPIDVCDRRPIHTTALQSEGNNGFHIKVDGLNRMDKYIPGMEYKVIINGSNPSQEILGVMLVAVPNGTKEEDKTLGIFKLNNNEDILQIAKQCNHAVLVHRFLLPKKGISVIWKAPERGSGCVQFRATVIEEADIWYKDHAELSKVICEEFTSEKTQKDEMVNDDQDGSCCACGYATYKMIFKGLWSRQTHPKDFPTQTHLLHWSNVVGASHSGSYRLWEYGQFASRAVRYVCEFGASNILEREMKTHSNKIRTVVKTPQMWNNVLNSHQALFTVTKDFNYLSLITMLGPSPDWCIGVSALNLCQQNCTWTDKIEVDLYPWDAGTDSGASYMSSNLKTEPQERIHRITNRYPNTPSSPFYDPNPIKPMARLYITKEKEKCNGRHSLDGSEEHSPSTEELVNMMKKKMQMKKKLEMEKCETSLWSEWTPCSASCGMGSQQRRRMLKHANILPSMCKTSLVETKKCFELASTCDTGINKKLDIKNTNKKTKMNLRPGKTLPENYEFKHQERIDINDKCAMTPWSPWSPCSVTCGRGMKERWRIFTSRSATPEKCNVRRMERDLCIGKIFDCQKAEMMKNWTSICSFPPDDGPCRGKFQRWYYDARMSKCIPFNYGGCRGNENRFESEEDCLKSCVVHMKKLTMIQKNGKLLDMELKIMRVRKRKYNKARHHRHVNSRVHCMVTPWSNWSNCSTTCGNGITMKTRSIKRKPINGGRKCPKRLVKKKKCKISRCSIHCKMSEWEDWSPCQATCGKNANQVRRRQRIMKPRRGGKTCPSRIERRVCNVPVCETDKKIIPTTMVKDIPPKKMI